ncbi:hypothetical protein KI688_008966 [Linnemannia hyalina]|uniref:Uncharacterized protein n=1 Tax=Linnemannia hyalina TaxID=64524 RepID=A0A9P7Y197_9FUNG|nr:hypothetical protein KI688_008966 [Linnemannia hyalina]
MSSQSAIPTAPPHPTAPLPLLDNTPADAPPTALANAPVIDEPAVRRIAGARINPIPVSRFDFRKESIQELILLRGLALHRPFVAPHGSGTDAWNKLVDYLHETDRTERPTTPFYTNVKPRSCKLAWERLFNEQKAYEATMLAATGIAPQETERRRLMKELNALKTAGAEAVADARQEKHRQLEVQTEDRRLGQLLLDSAESLSVRTRYGGGSDSESSAATSSTTTKYGKKRFTLQSLEKQQQESLEHVKGQTELLAQQLGLQREQMEHRKDDILRQEALDREKEARVVDREREKEQRQLEWEREKVRLSELREAERAKRQDEVEERRHKEFMEVLKQQSIQYEMIMSKAFSAKVDDVTK